MRTLRAAALSGHAFARFGTVIEAGAASVPVNQGRGRRFDLAPDAGQDDPLTGRPASAIYRLAPSTLPFAVHVIERHPLSTQLFYPNRAARFLVCVFASLPGGEPDGASAQAFVGVAHQGVIYRAGTWHGPLVALDAPGDFLMQMRESGGPLDCEERHLDTPLLITE